MARLRCPKCGKITDHTITANGKRAMCEVCLTSGTVKERK